MKYIKNGKLILPECEIGISEKKAIVFSNKIVGIIDEKDIGRFGFGEVYDAEGGIVSPGLIDVHIHGYMGEDSSDGLEEGLIKIAKELASNGVTAWLPTTMTVPKAQLEEAFTLIRKLKNEGVFGAAVAGAHAEGPFISVKYKGAQKADNILAPDAELLKKYSDVIKIVTMAPEEEGALEVIKEVTEDTDIVVSVGHSSATYAQACAGIESGVSHATHLFNAMSPLHHRDPGVVGAALINENVSCEIIADTFHINPALFNFVYKLKKDKLVLVTDCTRAGGLEDGEYDLGGQLIVKKGIECRLADGVIAGSVLKLNDALYNFRKHTELPDYEVIALATKNAAAVLKDSTRGTLEEGKRADIVIFDNDFNVKKTFVEGKVVY